MKPLAKSPHDRTQVEIGAAGLRSRFYLGPIQVRPDDGLLDSPHGQAHLEPKVMAVLQMLAENAGHVVARDELLDNVWRDAVVTEDALARCIYQLRHELPQLLGPDYQGPVIETLRKRGFRLVIPVTADKPVDPSDRGDQPVWQRWITMSVLLMLAVLAGIWLLQRPADNTRAPIQSIAVLPFANMTGDPEYDYLADGFSEQLSHALANVAGLKVAARTSTFYFKDRPAEIPTIAEQLNVESLLEGSIRRHGGQLRVTVQLIHDDGFHLWSGEYDRPLADTLRLQSEIAQQILMELGITDTRNIALEPFSPADNYQAYDRYLRGRLALQRRDPDAFAQATELFQQAIELDADYALAYTGLADAYSLQLSRRQVSPEAVTDKIDIAIAKALELNDQLAEAHASRGLQLFVLNEFAEAEPHLRHATELNPNYVNAHVWLGLDLVMQDRFSEAIEAYSQAQKLDPLDPSLNRNLGGNLLLLGRPEEGFTYLQRARQIAPEHPLAYEMLAGWGTVYGHLQQALEWSADGLQAFPDSVPLLTHQAAAHIQLGNWQAAHAPLERAQRLEPENQMLLEQLFYFHLATGDTASIEALLKQLGSDQPPFGQQPPFGKRRIVLRWLLLRQLLDNRPAQAIQLVDSLDVSDVLVCGSFGEPGPRLYLARALQLTGEQQRADELLADCVNDVNRLRAQGGTYPKSLYRMALTLALAGNHTQAAEVLQQGVELGWRGYWYAWNDPLWAKLKSHAPYRAIFADVASDLSQ